MGCVIKHNMACNTGTSRKDFNLRNFTAAGLIPNGVIFFDQHLCYFITANQCDIGINLLYTLFSYKRLSQGGSDSSIEFFFQSLT